LKLQLPSADELVIYRLWLGLVVLGVEALSVLLGTPWLALVVLYLLLLVLVLHQQVVAFKSALQTLALLV